MTERDAPVVKAVAQGIMRDLRPRAGLCHFARHLRPEAHRPHRPPLRLHRLWPGHSRPRPPARRMGRHRRHGGVGQGDGDRAQRAAQRHGCELNARSAAACEKHSPRRNARQHKRDLLQLEFTLLSATSFEHSGDCTMKSWKTILAAAALALASSTVGTCRAHRSRHRHSARAAASRSDRGRRRRDRRGALRQRLRGPDPHRPERRGAAGSRRKLDRLRRRQGLHLQAAHRRQIPRRHRFQRRRREILARPRPRRQFHQRAEGPVRGDRHGRSRRSGDRQGHAEEPAGLVPLQYGLGRRGDRRAGDRPRPTRKSRSAPARSSSTAGPRARRSRWSKSDSYWGDPVVARQGRVPHHSRMPPPPCRRCSPATSRPSPILRSATRRRRSRPTRASRW